ncbi:MAG: hypothetical protein HRU38_19195 [Saccharospirillaceae bacterium]|nr:hypothetical protein [Pseudomonadales bacterium]NRB80762.1 hypothetical protein [Saccharospirillaceae bacterium]
MRRFVLFTLIVSLSSISIAFDKIVNLSVFEIKPYFNKDLPGGGLALDIIREAFTRSGWIINTKEYPTFRLSREVSKGNIDGFFMATTNFPAPDFIFSEPYIKTKLILVGNNSNSFEYIG